MKKQVSIWIRVSTEDQAQGDSPEHHEHRARAYAEAKGWAVAEVYHLEAVSGKSVLQHPEARRMLDDVRKGHITGLIFSKLARLARNTRELLDFADFFNSHNADLVSLGESIDTSSPAGRLFYTLIAATAQFEREEIASRVKASVPIRAKLGKPLGGEAPFGYRWENKALVIDENEAQVRKLVYELFAEHRRKRIVVKILNERGYRTRHGKFTDTTVHRMLRDPLAKGIRRVNYNESSKAGKERKIKPKEEWVFVEVPKIVSSELWDVCNSLLDEMSKGKVRRKGVHLFSGLLTCTCGTRMNMRSVSPKYVCPNCKNKVDPDDLEAIFHEQLKSFLFSEAEVKAHLDKEKSAAEEKERLLLVLKKELEAHKKKVADILDLYREGKISMEQFQELNTPAYERQKQVEASMLQIRGEIDAILIQSLDSEQVIYDAQNLQTEWHNLSKKDKQSIIQAITESIVVGREDIEINLKYMPALAPHDVQAKETLLFSPDPLFLIVAIMQHIFTG